jgi:hypothetical protein
MTAIPRRFPPSGDKAENAIVRPSADHAGWTAFKA